MTAGTTMYTCERPVVHHFCLAPSRHSIDGCCCSGCLAAVPEGYGSTVG